LGGTLSFRQRLWETYTAGAMFRQGLRLI